MIGRRMTIISVDCVNIDIHRRHKMNPTELIPMTPSNILQDEQDYLLALPKLTASDQLIDDLFGHKNYVRIPKFFETQGGVLSKILLSLDKPHVRKATDIRFATDNGLLIAFIPNIKVATIKTPSEVFYDAFNK